MRRRHFAAVCALAAAVGGGFPRVEAIDISGVQNGALDQPRINAAVYSFGDGQPLTNPLALGIDVETLELTFGPSYNLEAYLDTGASGVLLSNSFQQNYLTTLSEPLALQGSAVYADVGVNGSGNFAVSTPIVMHLAPYVYGNPAIDAFSGGGANLAGYAPIPTTIIPAGSLRATVGPVQTTVEDPGSIDAILQGLLGDFDIVGMPAMKGRVVVMDARQVNNFDALFNFDPFTSDAIPDIFMRTYVYDTHQGFDAGNVLDPGVPATSHHVKLSYASFDRFTQTSGPAGTTAPTLEKSPIIGVDPNTYPVMLDKDHPGGAKGGIRIARTYDVLDPTTREVLSTIGGAAEGNFLLDTGAAASIISKRMALSMGVAYSGLTEPNPADPEGAEIPYLVDVNGDRITDQFRLQLNGVGGTSTLAGFYVDDLLLRTLEGGQDDASTEHFHFLHAPVLVGDITLKDPTKLDGDPTQFLTLDGILGMNFMVASGLIDSTSEDGLPTNLGFGSFDWITIDFTDPDQGVLGLNYAPFEAVPEPGSLMVLGIGAAFVGLRRRGRGAKASAARA